MQTSTLIERFQLLLANMLQTGITMGVFVLALWIIYVVDSTLLNDVLKKRYSIQPRARFNLASMLIAPFIHVNRQHLAANSIPLFILGSLVLIQGQAAFWLATAIIILVAGLGVWFFGKSNTRHMGASGLILGYFGYTLSNLFFAPDLATLIVAIVVGVLYLGLIWQVVPFKEGVSTMGHLFGFLGGILAAWVMALLPTGMVG